MVRVYKFEDVPGDYKSLGILKTKEEALQHYAKWERAKPTLPFLISTVIAKDGTVWYSVWTRTPKNSKKQGRLRK